MNDKIFKADAANRERTVFSIPTDMQIMSNSTLTLTEEQIQFFKEQGYLRLEQISPPEEVEFLKGVYDRLFAEKAGRRQGAYFDAVSTDEDDDKPHTSPQIIDPVLFAPELKKTIFRRMRLRLPNNCSGQRRMEVLSTPF